MTRTSHEGFIVIEINGKGFRYWIWSSDVDAAQFQKEMKARFPENDYTLRRADVAQLG